ncbi:MAG: DUF6144 family protein [Armatimonadota bacterium]|nr:DUF6144 family protein [bacterium]
MQDYEYGRIGQLAKKLEQFEIDESIIEQIMAGGETIRKNATPQKKAQWLKGAMDRMDTLLDESTRRAVRESCACCLGGKRLEISKQIAKTNATLEDRIKAANEAKFVFGNSVTMEDNGKIVVSFFPEGLEKYRCVCLPKASEPVSVTYCYCCGGHAKHHLQIALDKKLTCKVRSSALSSEGKQPCTFEFSINE